MTTQTQSVGLPRSVFLKLERAAKLTHRTIADVLVTMVNAALVEHPDLADELSAMYFFSDEALWAVTHPCLSPVEHVRLNQLNHKARERPLTRAEAAEREYLLAAYHRSVLRRAKALAVLVQRGHPLPVSPEFPDTGI